MIEPDFWYNVSLKINPFKKIFLWLLSLLFSAGAFFKKQLTRTRAVSKPVICIGNLTIGGAGKTPTTLSIAQYLKGKGKAVAIISRGYKGELKGPLHVGPTHHTALEVGDEPLLMAHSFETWISANRYKGAKAAIDQGADIILLDDGLQHPTLKQDLKICVVNTNQKFGNENRIPLGPLRENLQKGLERIDAILTVSNTLEERFSLNIQKPLLRTEIALNKKDWAALKDKKLIAFAGLAHPEKFFETLRLEKFNILKTLPFPDHYTYTQKDLKKLINLAEQEQAQLVTTQKDWVRLPKEFQEQIAQLRITLEYQDPHLLRRLLDPFLKESNIK